jgi:hypothetical protein
MAYEPQGRRFSQMFFETSLALVLAWARSEIRIGPMNYSYIIPVTGRYVLVENPAHR